MSFRCAAMGLLGYSTLEEYISGATFTMSAPVIASMPVERR